MEPGTTLNLGEIFTVGTDKWLCIAIDALHEVYYKGNVMQLHPNPHNLSNQRKKLVQIL